MSTVKVVSCSCEHGYQDKKYGNKKRVANLTQGDKAKPKHRCTVCAAIK